MDKKKIISEIIKELEREFKTLSKAAKEARDEATHEETQAENEYDTRGLEASYLAGAQAKRADEIKTLIQIFSKLEPQDYDGDTPIGSTALVRTEIDGEDARWFFLIPHQGGINVTVDGNEIYAVSLDSPVGKELKEQGVGHAFTIKTKDSEIEYEVMQVL